MNATTQIAERLTEEEWRTREDFRRYWPYFCDCDPIPIDVDDFTSRLEAAGYIEARKVKKRDLENESFAAEKGLELGGLMWALTDKGRSILSPTPSGVTVTECSKR